MLLENNWIIIAVEPIDHWLGQPHVAEAVDIIGSIPNFSTVCRDRFRASVHHLNWYRVHLLSLYFFQFHFLWWDSWMKKKTGWMLPVLPIDLCCWQIAERETRRIVWINLSSKVLWANFSLNKAEEKIKSNQLIENDNAFGRKRVINNSKSNRIVLTYPSHDFGE